MSADANLDFDEGSPRRVDVELFIIHPTMTPADITAALGLESDVEHRVGGQRKTPKGTLLGGTYPDTRWRHCIRLELRNQWFADKIALLLDRLTPHREFFGHVRATGDRAAIIIQFLGDGYLGDSVSSETLGRLVELQLDFDIECYAVPQS
jgi:hypothetical protein